MEQLDVVPRTGGADNYLRADDLNPNSNGVRTILGLEPGSKLPRIIENIRGGRVKVLLVLGENIMKLGLGAADLQKVGFIAHSHILANSTAEQSHVVLPSSQLCREARQHDQRHGPSPAPQQGHRITRRGARLTGRSCVISFSR